MVELRETGNIMVDMARMMITSGANGQKVNGGALINAGQKKPPELKATLYTWRERLPNKWDALKDWDDIFCWRTEVRRSTVLSLLFLAFPPSCLQRLFMYIRSILYFLSVSSFFPPCPHPEEVIYFMLGYIGNIPTYEKHVYDSRTGRLHFL